MLNGSENKRFPGSTVNPDYTFETFAIGDESNLAHAACLAVTCSPGECYNPLFIYGKPSLGKTHLLHAVGNKILSKNSNATVLYTTAEQLTSEIIFFLERRDFSLSPFKEKLRSLNVLLIDDLHSLAGKDGIQEVFTCLFDFLCRERVQMVIASSLPLSAFPAIQEFIRKWKLLIVDIQPPETETKIAVLKKHAEREKISVPEDVLAYIAENIPENIRMLEGALNRLAFHASLNNENITLHMAEAALKPYVFEKDGPVIAALIIEQTAEYFGIATNDLAGTKREQRYSLPRKVALYLTREITAMSFRQIAKAFSLRHHASVLRACREISSAPGDSVVRNAVERIRERTGFKKNG